MLEYAKKLAGIFGRMESNVFGLFSAQEWGHAYTCSRPSHWDRWVGRRDGEANIHGMESANVREKETKHYLRHNMNQDTSGSPGWQNTPRVRPSHLQSRAPSQWWVAQFAARPRWRRGCEWLLAQIGVHLEQTHPFLG